MVVEPAVVEYAAQRLIVSRKYPSALQFDARAGKMGAAIVPRRRDP